MLMACEKLQGVRTCVTLVGVKSKGILIAMLLACEKLQGKHVMLVNDKSQGIRTAMLT